LIAQVWLLPALIDVQLLSAIAAPTLIGTSDRVVLPVPSWPVAFEPQQ
jgi:hypothetical protein